MPRDEGAFRDQVLGALAAHFDIAQQVGGSHFSGKRLKIDAIVVPKDKHLWHDQTVALGIEFKDAEGLMGDTKNFAKWLAQCVDYSNTNWDDYGYLHVFACPTLTDGFTFGQDRPDTVRVLHAVLGQLGIGELSHNSRYGLTFVLKGNHRIWSTVNGVECGKDWSLRREFGSR